MNSKVECKKYVSLERNECYINIDKNVRGNI